MFTRASRPAPFPARLGNRVDHLPAALLALAAGVLLVAGIYGTGLGLAADTDSPSIQEAARSIANGTYARSRTTGFPLYEGLVALMTLAGAGLVAINAFSLLMAGIAVALAVSLARAIGADRFGAAAAGIAVALHPLVLTNASAMMETATVIALALAFWRCSLAAAGQGRAGMMDAACIVLGIAMVLTRIDTAIVAIGMSAALALRALRAHGPAAAARWILMLAAIGIASLATYLLLNGGLGFLSSDFLRDQSLKGRLLFAVLGLANTLQPVGLAALLLFILARRRSPPATPHLDDARRLFRTALIVTGLLYGLRFAVLPDELEYIVIPVLLFIIYATAHLRAPAALLVILAVSVVQNLVTLGYARPAPGAGMLAVRPRLAPGPVLQDFDLRANMQLLTDPSFARWLAAQAGMPGVPLSLPRYGLGLTSPGRDLVIGRPTLYRLDNPRLTGDRFRRTSYGRVVVCDEALLLDRGWRVFQYNTPPRATRAYLSGQRLHCADLEG
jgi:hypothetical protein